LSSDETLLTLVLGRAQIIQAGVQMIGMTNRSVVARARRLPEAQLIPPVPRPAAI